MQTNSAIKQTDSKVIDFTGIFNDKRLEKRGEKILDDIVNKETAVLNQFSDDRADLVGASRFFDNDSVTEDALIKATSNRCTKSCNNKHVLAQGVNFRLTFTILLRLIMKSIEVN